MSIVTLKILYNGSKEFFFFNVRKLITINTRYPHEITVKKINKEI